MRSRVGCPRIPPRLSSIPTFSEEHHVNDLGTRVLPLRGLSRLEGEGAYAMRLDELRVIAVKATDPTERLRAKRGGSEAFLELRVEGWNAPEGAEHHFRDQDIRGPLVQGRA
jgi:hypothetical protein